MVVSLPVLGATERARTQVRAPAASGCLLSLAT